jgi:hypothetical protein
MNTQRDDCSIGYFSQNLTHYIVSMRWHVYEKYEIRDFKNEEELEIYDSSYFGGDRVAPELFETIHIKEGIKLSVYLLPGKYITWFESDMPSNSIKHFYNPIEEGTELLNRFLRLGHGNVPTRMIHSFVQKYGILKEIEQNGIELKSGFVYPRYPLDAMKKYAREAYYINSLYQSLSNKDIKALRDSLKVVSDNVKGGFTTVADPFKAEVDFGDFIRSWWHKIPEHFRSHLTALMPKSEAELVDLVDAGERVKEDTKKIPIAFFMPLLSQEFWDIFTALSPNEMIIDYTNRFISSIFQKRLWEGVRIDPVMESTFLNGDDSSISYRMRPKSLLSAIWFLLYLDITGQSVSYYSFCDYCGIKIPQKIGEKGYRGNIYCSDNHRTYAYNRDMKGVIELGKIGSSLEIIKEAYPRRSESSIVRWLVKEGIEVRRE